MTNVNATGIRLSPGGMVALCDWNDAGVLGACGHVDRDQTRTVREMSSGEDITHKVGPWITRFGCPRMLRGRR
jgi:hypothetical protein